MYVCCVHDPTRRARNVYLWTCLRPRGRAATAPHTVTTLGALRKALREAELWPVAANDVGRTDAQTSAKTGASNIVVDNDTEATGASASSPVSNTSSSSHASRYVRTSSLKGAPLMLSAWVAIEAYARDARAAKEACAFTLVYEPLLRMATVRVLLNRLSAAHTKTTVEDVHTFADLVTDADAVSYAHDLVDVVLDVQGASTTRTFRRRRTLRTNLARCSVDWDDETLMDLDRYVARCTQHDDHTTDQEPWFQRLVRYLSTALKHAPLRQRIDFDDDPHLVAPFEVARTRSNRYGFVQHGDIRAEMQGTGRAADRLLVDLPSSVLYATQTALAVPPHSVVDTLYTQALLKPAIDALMTTPKHDDFLFQVTRGKVRAHLNRSRMPVQLYQLYNQLRTSKTFPLFALYHQTPGLKRRILRAQYHESSWDPRRAHNGHVAASAIPGATLLDAYLQYVDTQDSTIWLEHGNPDVAQFLDLVVYVKPHYYLCVLDREGTMDAHLVPWHTTPTTHTRARSHPSISLALSLRRAVHKVLPAVNHWIRAVNAVRYPVATAAHSTSPHLLEWTMESDEDRVYAAPHVHLQQYTAQSSFRAPRACVVEAFRTLSYVVLPTATTSTALASNPPATLRQLWARLGHPSATNQALVRLVQGRTEENTGATPTEAHTLVDRLYAANNRDTACTLLVRSGCSRFGLDDRSGYATLRHAVPLAVNVQAEDVRWRVSPSAYVLPKQREPSLRDHPVQPVHPSVLYEFAVLAAYAAHRFRHSPAWPRLQRGLADAAPTRRDDRHNETVHCRIPVLAAAHGHRLQNVKNTIGPDRYRRHVAKCTSKGHFARVCQTANQPWCVPATTTVSFRRWCRYACVPPEHDYWMSATVRDRLRLHRTPTVFRGPYRVQYTGVRTHAQLVHNMFKMQNLGFAESVCDVLRTTLFRLIAESYRLLHPRTEGLPHANATDEIVREWFKRAVHDRALLRRAMRLHDETFATTDSLPSLSTWVAHYGGDAAAWRMWVHLAQRFARTLYYLPHPFLKTASRDTIHFCCPLYVCGRCKVPMAAPETPAYYYADPPTDDDLCAAFAHATTTYLQTPIAEVAVRRCRAAATTEALDFSHGDLDAAGTRELAWAHSTPATDTSTVAEKAPPLYGRFGTALTLNALMGLQLRVHVRHGGEYEATCAILVGNDEGRNAGAATEWTFRRVATTTRSTDETYVYPTSEGGYIVTSTLVRPTEGSTPPACTRLPTSFVATVHCMAIDVPAPQQLPTTTSLMTTSTHPPAYVVVRAGPHRATLVRCERVPLCVRFRQFRAIDPLKTLCVPAALLDGPACQATTVCLTGIVHYEPKRTERAQQHRTRQSRKRQREARKALTRTNRGGGGANGGKTTTSNGNRNGNRKGNGDSAANAHIIRRTLAEALREGLVAKAMAPDFDTVDAGDTCRLKLRWGLCGEWTITFADAATYQRVYRLNEARTLPRFRKGKGTPARWDTVRVGLTDAGMVAEPQAHTLRLQLNDDRRFQCPRCGICNHQRNFYTDHGAKYGQIAAIKTVPTVGTDPDWMYVSSFKAAGAKLNPRNYERLWNRAPDRAHEEYRIPLGLTTVTRSTRPKAFNCNVQKVARTDTFTIQSFNLHTLLEQPTILEDAGVGVGVGEGGSSFVVTGTVPANDNTGATATLHNLWQCLTEEAINDAWLDAALTPARVLNLAGGRLIRARRATKMRDAVPSTAMSTQWLQHPGVTTAIASTKAYLRASLLMDTGLTGDLVYWWEWMATLGYDPRSRMARAATTRASSPLALFLLDVRQTHDGNNFAPRVMAPPHGDVRRVVWDPYEAPTEQENTPYLLFAVALKVQCRTTYGDAFYVLRASQRANAVPLFICTRARVRRFLDEGVTTFDEARAMHRKSATARSTETELMYECALLYCKLYKRMVDSIVYHWYPEPAHPRTDNDVATTGLRTRLSSPARIALVAGLRAAGYVHRHQVTVDPDTFQVRQLVFHHKAHQLWLPIAMDWTDDCVPVDPAPANPPAYVHIGAALEALAVVAQTMVLTAAWDVRQRVVDAFGRVVALDLVGGGCVPVSPERLVHDPNRADAPLALLQLGVATANHHNPLTTHTPDTHIQSHHEYTGIWDDFVELCEHLSRHFRRQVTALDTTCRAKGSAMKPCLEYRLREQIDATLHTPPASLSSALRTSLQTDRRYAQALLALLESHVVYAEASTVRMMVLAGDTLTLRKLLLSQRPTQLSVDAETSPRTMLPRYDFPAAQTQTIYERQGRQPTDTLFHTLMAYTRGSDSSVSMDDGRMLASEEPLRPLPSPWRQSLPQARLVVRDGFTVLAEATSMQKRYLADSKGRQLLSLDAIVPLLKFPVYLLNEPRVLATDAVVSKTHGPVMYVHTVHTQSYRAQAVNGGLELQTPDLPSYLPDLLALEQEAKRPLRIVYHDGMRAHTGVVSTIRGSTMANQWHTLVLDAAVPVTSVPRPAVRNQPLPTWRLDPTHYHVARYHLIKEKIIHKRKLKNILPARVERALGADTPWRPMPPYTPGSGPRHLALI